MSMLETLAWPSAARYPARGRGCTQAISKQSRRRESCPNRARCTVDGRVEGTKYEPDGRLECPHGTVIKVRWFPSPWGTQCSAPWFSACPAIYPSKLQQLEQLEQQVRNSPSQPRTDPFLKINPGTNRPAVELHMCPRCQQKIPA